MSQLTKTAYEAKYNSSGTGAFLDNNTQAIVEGTMRGFAKDSSDSFVYLGADAPADFRTVALTAHGFALKDCLTLNGSGVPIKISTPGTDKFIGIVTSVIDANNFVLTMNGYVSAFSGLTAGTLYYIQATGTIGTGTTAAPILSADSTSSGYILFSSSGGGGGITLPFSSSQLTINNPAGTFAYTFTSAAITAARTITLPLLTGNDVMVTQDFPQTLTQKTLTAPAINGATVFTSNLANQLLVGGTFTAAAATDYLMGFGGSVTANSAGGVVGYDFHPTMTASGTSSTQIGVNISPTFTGGTTPILVALRVGINGGAMLFGPTANAPINGEIFQVRRDANSGNYMMLCNNTSGTAASSGVFITNSSSLATYSLLVNLSAGFTASGIYISNTAALATTQSAGLNIGTIGANQVSIWSNNIKRASWDGNGNLTLTPGAVGTGQLPGFIYTAPANTGGASATEYPNFILNTSSQQWGASGTVAQQRNAWIKAITYTSVTATSTVITSAYGLWIDQSIAGANVTIANNFALGLNGDIGVQGHIIGLGSAPTIATGTGAGTSPTLVSVTGTDMAGTVSLTTGTTPTAAGDVVTITFNKAFANSPRIVFCAAAVASGTPSISQVYVSSTTTTFKITCVTGFSLTASTAYSWNYQVVQ